jgi:hypothetical protein
MLPGLGQQLAVSLPFADDCIGGLLYRSIHALNESRARTNLTGLPLA